jgi:pimeloyl-ACP methyl ester carboxylesterase
MEALMPEQPTVQPSSGMQQPVSPRGADGPRAPRYHIRSRPVGYGRRWAGVSTIAALIWLGSGCGSDNHGSGGNTQPSYAEAPCPDPVYPGFVLGPGYTCGYLTVPENRRQPNGRTIRLAVATHRATAPNPKPDPIVFLTGGPGGSGLAEGPGVAQAWRPDRDVIFLDQRGELQSKPFLSCPEIDAFMAGTVGLSWLAPETIEEDAAVTGACRERLAAAGADLAAYSTTESSADVADLRIAMGIKEWNIYGVSYGTDLALQTLRDHPAGIRSVVVDAVLPPTINPIENGWRAALESSTAIYDACAAQPACAAAFPDGRAEYIRVINDLAANPRTVQVTDPKTDQEVTVVIDAYKLSYTVQFSTLIGTQKNIPLLIHDLAVGNGTEAALEVLSGVFPPDFNSYGLLWGVLCREFVGRTDPERVSAAGKRTLPDFPDSVTDRPSMFPWAFSDCAQWDVPTAPSGVARVVTSDVPVLLTSGSFDGTAPPSYAAEAAKTLKHSTNLVFPGVGHSASRWASECFATILANFLDQPEGFDYSCLADQTVPEFCTIPRTCTP